MRDLIFKPRLGLDVRVGEAYDAQSMKWIRGSYENVHLKVGRFVLATFLLIKKLVQISLF